MINQNFFGKASTVEKKEKKNIRRFTFTYTHQTEVFDRQWRLSTWTSKLHQEILVLVGHEPKIEAMDAWKEFKAQLKPYLSLSLSSLVRNEFGENFKWLSCFSRILMNGFLRWKWIFFILLFRVLFKWEENKATIKRVREKDRESGNQNAKR